MAHKYHFGGWCVHLYDMLIFLEKQLTCQNLPYNEKIFQEVTSQKTMYLR